MSMSRQFFECFAVYMNAHSDYGVICLRKLLYLLILYLVDSDVCILNPFPKVLLTSSNQGVS